TRATPSAASSTHSWRRCRRRPRRRVCVRRSRRRRRSWARRRGPRPASVAEGGEPPHLWVLAGTNGAGKSSVGGAMVRQHHGHYFNPDEAAARLRAANRGITVEAANGAAWLEGKRLLE